MNTYIIGHQQPDLDSVASTLLFAYIYSQKKCFNYQNLIPSLPQPINPETKTILKQLKINSPQVITAKNIQPEDKIILVDHNEADQRLPNLNPDQIVEIIDHHKINLNLNQPIHVTVKTWGSTATIACSIASIHSIKLPIELQKLAAVAIISDTIYFKSPTATDKDREVFESLIKSAQISHPDKFALDILKAKSDVSSLSPKEIILNDSKIFNFNQQKIRISVIETVEPQVHLDKLSTYLQAMEQIKQAEKLNHIFFCLVDIFNENTQLVYLTEAGRGVAEAAFSGQGKNNLLDIGKRLSRKKEIAPPIEKVL